MQIRCPHKPQDQVWVWGDSDSSGKEVSSAKSLVLTFCMRHEEGARHHLETEPTVSTSWGSENSKQPGGKAGVRHSLGRQRREGRTEVESAWSGWGRVSSPESN